MELYKNPDFALTVAGIRMPLFIYTVHFIGKIVFAQYAGTALWLNFVFAAAGACCIRHMTLSRFGESASSNTVTAVFAVPFMFLLFTPDCYGVLFGLLCMAVCALYKKNTVLYAVFAAAAILTSKLGLLAVIPFILLKAVKSGKFKILSVKSFPPPQYRFAAGLFMAAVADGMFMFMTVGGAL